MAQIINNLTAEIKVKVKGLQRQIFGIRLIAFIARMFKIECEVSVNNLKDREKEEEPKFKQLDLGGV